MTAAHKGKVFQLKIPDDLKKALKLAQAESAESEDMTDILISGLVRELKRRGQKISSTWEKVIQ